MGDDENNAPHRRHWYFWTGPRAVFRAPAFTVFPAHFLHRTSGAFARSFPSDVVSWFRISFAWTSDVVWKRVRRKLNPKHQTPFGGNDTPSDAIWKGR